MDRFYFRADDQFTQEDLAKIYAKYPQYDILFGVDPGEGDTPSDVAQPLINYIKDYKTFHLHIYLVGPGMLSWSSQERAQIKKFAASVGIDINKKSWYDKWIEWGWKDKVLQQFEYYWNTFGVYSCEIDNLDSALDTEDKLLVYYSDLKSSLAQKNMGCKLMLKNISEDALYELIKQPVLCKDFLAPFAIFEKGSGNPKTQMMLCEKLGIQAITPINGLMDTYNYGVDKKGIKWEVDKDNILV